MTTPRTDDTAPLSAWAQHQTLPYAAAPGPAQPESRQVESQQPEATSVGSAPDPGPAVAMPHTAPALNPPTWSGRKTAVAAALAIGISSMGAVAAAAALPAGTTQGGGQLQQGGFGPGGRQGGFSPQGPGQRPQQGTQQGTQQGAQQGTQQAPADPNASTT